MSSGVFIVTVFVATLILAIVVKIMSDKIMSPLLRTLKTTGERKKEKAISKTW